MRKLEIGIVVMCSLTLASGLVVAGTAEHRLMVEDPAGDVDSSGEHPAMDVVSVALDSDGIDLHVEITLAKEAAYYLDGHLAGTVASLLFDVDGNLETGGKVVFGRKPGFDIALNVDACIKYEDGEACAGGLGDSKVEGFFSSYQVLRYEQDAPFPESIHGDPFWKSPRQPITGQQIRVSVPYAMLGFEAGQELRVSIREADAGMFEEAFSDDVSLTLN